MSVGDGGGSQRGVHLYGIGQMEQPYEATSGRTEKPEVVRGVREQGAARRDPDRRPAKVVVQAITPGA
jgi:hypothetical protein